MYPYLLIPFEFITAGFSALELTFGVAVNSHRIHDADPVALLMQRGSHPMTIDTGRLQAHVGGCHAPLHQPRLQRGIPGFGVIKL